MERICCLMILFLFMIGCATTEEVWTGQNQNPIKVVCGPSCKTIYFKSHSAYLTTEQRYRINEFVYQSRRRQPIFISLCDTNSPNLQLNTYRLHIIERQVKNLGFKPVFLKPTLPADLGSKNCANLVRGKLKLYVQGCPNRTLTPSVQNVESNFGCTTNYNLAQMIINPWNLLAREGDNGTEGDRVALGIYNYRIAKSVDLNAVGSDSDSVGGDLAQ